MTIIIAEAGVNHNGDILKAYKLVDAAVQARANIVKFQTFSAKSLTTYNAEKANYQKLNTANKESQQNMLRKLELSHEDHFKIKAYCDKKGIEFLSTPFDKVSIDFLKSFNLKRWKIPSGEITNIPYLRSIASQGKPIILSTGMSNLEEIGNALNVIQKEGLSKDLVTVLQCTTSYPAPFHQINLNAMKTIANTFDVKVGFSDHTCDIFIPVAAVAMGATVIEKHFTLDKSMEGPDHKASLEPEELKNMIDAIRNVECALGDGKKRLLECEIENIVIARKSIVSKNKIKKGDYFSESNITSKRPAKGISPIHWDEIIGRKATKDYYPDEFITW